ncbi:MAG: hypothetical protein ACRERC_10215 [Candidatus Binatia bacterium]
MPSRVKGPRNRGHGIWAITSYFNPAGYRSRLKNYRIFRQRLAVPLLAVELSCTPQFELGAADADVLVQLRGDAILWQKERLLNLALQSLPDECETVAWLDCDVVLTRPDWPLVANQLLHTAPLVQLFHARYNLPADTLPEQVASPAAYAAGHALGYTLAHRLAAPAVVGEPASASRAGVALGLAWAAPRRLLETHGFYDAGVLGGGDRALACAAVGQFDGLRATWGANEAQSVHFAAWARPFHAAVRGNVAWVDGAIFHLWHGHRDDRRYVERYEKFRVYEFDPSRDIALDHGGCWRWNSDKPDMHRYVSDYFHARREDG